jgi:ribosomal protein L21E
MPLCMMIIPIAMNVVEIWMVLFRGCERGQPRKTFEGDRGYVVGLHSESSIVETADSCIINIRTNDITCSSVRLCK